MKLLFLVCIGFLVVAANAIEQENKEDESDLAIVDGNDDGTAVTLEKLDDDDEVETTIEATRVKRGAGKAAARRRKAINRFKHRRARALRRRHAKNIRRAAAKRARHHRRARIVHRRIARNRRRQRLARG
ncbi:hypothetical protein OSTOST_18656 [Ostertagia ostertagi]